jgi:hypothetical protein
MPRGMNRGVRCCTSALLFIAKPLSSAFRFIGLVRLESNSRPRSPPELHNRFPFIALELIAVYEVSRAYQFSMIKLRL